MKYIYLFLLTYSPVLFFAQTSGPYTIENVPNPKEQGNGYVSDPGGIIGPMALAQLNAIASEMEDSSATEIAVVILPSIGDENPKDFTTALFNHWGIGKSGKDNGLLILTVMDQRRTEFETGYGMEGILPDVICYRIGMQVLVPYFQEGKYGEGLVATLTRFQAIILKPESLEELQSGDNAYGQAKDRRKYDPGLIFLVVYLAVSTLTGLLLFRYNILTIKGKDELYDKYKKVQRYHSVLWAIFFPLGCLPIYFWNRALLKKLRNHPRFSKLNGKPMRKLRESEENNYLEKGQITEEDIRSVDYDVWITDDADDILILRYENRFTKYSTCPECGFKTYYKAHSEITQAATYSSTGQQELTYCCKNCNYSHIKVETIPMKTDSGSSRGNSSSGGGSWGGGRSGGGGAGVSW